MPVNYYNETVAARYDSLRRWRNAIPERLVEITGLTEASLALDVGCGTGNLTQAVRQICPCRFVGLDLSPAMIKVAAGKLPSTSLVRADCAEMPFGMDRFDAVIGSFFMHHVPRERRPRLISEAYRVLAKGRFAVITRSHEQLENSHYKSFFPEVISFDLDRFPRLDDLVEWMSGCGFEDIRVETVMDAPITIDRDFLYRVENKLISTLDMISDKSFRAGLNKMREHIEETRGRETVIERPLTIVSGRK